MTDSYKLAWRYRRRRSLIDRIESSALRFCAHVAAGIATLLFGFLLFEVLIVIEILMGGI